MMILLTCDQKLTIKASLVLHTRRLKEDNGFHSNVSACVGKQPIMIATASTEHSYWLALAFVAWKFVAAAFLANKDVYISRNKRKRQPIGMLGRSSGNHDWLLANASACVSCGFRLRNARNASDCVWMESGLEGCQANCISSWSNANSPQLYYICSCTIR